MGHAVRVASVLEELGRRFPLRLTVVAPCDPRVWPAALAPATEAWERLACDAGVVQSDDVTVDLAATEARLDRWLREAPALVEREVERLRGGFDLVVGDVPSAAFEAADHLQIRSFAVANFSWDWIYSQLGFDAAAQATAAGYARAGLLLEALPFGPMPAFARRVGVGLVTRRPSSPERGEQVRRRLGIEASQKAVLLAFQPASPPAMQLPPERPGRVYVVPSAWPLWRTRPDVRILAEGESFVDAMAAADVVVGKPGYGLIGDVEASGVRFLYAPRPGFPENAVLEEHLSRRAATRALEPSRLDGRAWEEDLEEIEGLDAPPAAETGGAARAAAAIVEDLGGIDSDEARD